MLRGIVAVVVALLIVTDVQAEERRTHEGIIGPIGGPGPGHGPAADACCGQDTFELAGRFAAALRARPGRVHPLAAVRLPGRPSHPAVNGEVVVRLARGVDADELARRLGLVLRRVIPALRICTLGSDGSRPEDLVSRVSSIPGVEWASPNWVARCLLTSPNDDFFPMQTGARAIEVERAWDDSKGRGVVVAILDTGVDAKHPDLLTALATNGWVDLVNGSASPSDDNGHGTAMAGIVASRFDNAIGTAGVAPEASLVAIKVADRDGHASFADIAAGLVEAVRRGASVVSISMGAPVDDPTLRAGVEHAVNAGVVVVAAAGNENVNAPYFPAAYSGVVAVGGAGSQSSGPGGVTPPSALPPPEIAFSTVLAPSLSVLAPAEKVVVPLPGGVYGFMSGTSVAAAHVAGVVALVRAHAPGLDRARVGQVVRHSADPVRALSAVDENFPFGRVNARKALERDGSAYADVAIRSVTLMPEEPVAGESPVLRVRLENQGNARIGSLVLRAEYASSIPPSPREISLASVANLDMGEVRNVDLLWRAANLPGPGSYDVTVIASGVAGETEVADNSRKFTVVVGTAATSNVRIARFEARQDFLAPTPGISVEGVVRNLGNRDETNVDVTLVVNGVAFRTARIAFLATGAEQVVQAVWPLPPTPPERVVFGLEIAPRAGETRLEDNSAEAIVRVGVSGTRPVGVLYQQSNGVDLISDAPFRIAANRSYVPLLLFAPSKGSTDSDTYLTFSKVRVVAKMDPASAALGALVYEDSTGGSPTAAPGVEALDEMGSVQATPDIFQDQELRQNGRHMVLRVPGNAWPLSGLPSDGYLDARMEWEFHRKLLWFFVVTRSGTNAKVMRVTFAKEPLPALPGENHYYDVHYHTIAEWYMSSWVDLLAPRKAYGGPVVMTAESAYAIGMIDSPTALKDLVATTDHNTFYNETVGDPNDRTRRPPFGPTSPAASIGPGGTVVPEHARYREIFGVAAGEEVAVNADQAYSAGGLSITLPMGSHLIGYRGEHVEGPWNGGGWIPDPSSPNIDVELPDLLRTWAGSNQAQNSRAFLYSAHPFSVGLGLPEPMRRLALGLDPSARTLDFVHASPPAFVFKGFQLFNGRGARSIPSSSVDFDDLNPWVDPSWQAGNPLWDGQLGDGLVYWHGAIADLLSFAFASDPDGVFVRKVFIAGGSDAHGDFNFDISRLATPLTLHSTFSVGSSPYGCVRTYVLADGAPGSTPGERYMQAFAAGRSVATDGPLVSFTLDAEGRFDAANLRWHDRIDRAEDGDGRIGGGGSFDGEGTALVVNGCESVWFRYAFASAKDIGSGDVAAIKIYRDAPGSPNPSRSRGSSEEPVGVGSLTVTGTAGTLRSERIDPNEEGLVTAPTAYSLGAFTGGDPDIQPLGVDERRCYTNPIWALPVSVSVNAAHVAPDVIAAGELRVLLDFPISMSATAGSAELKALDRDGNSTDGSAPGTALSMAFSRANGARDARLALTNAQPIPLVGDPYPVAGKRSYVVYFREPLRDMNGNALNSLAFTFATDAPAATGVVSSPSTPGAPSPASSGGSGGSGGCAASRIGSTQAFPSVLPWVTLVALLLVRRLKRTAS